MHWTRTAARTVVGELSMPFSGQHTGDKYHPNGYRSGGSTAVALPIDLYFMAKVWEVRGEGWGWSVINPNGGIKESGTSTSEQGARSAARLRYRKHVANAIKDPRVQATIQAAKDKIQNSNPGSVYTFRDPR